MLVLLLGVATVCACSENDRPRLSTPASAACAVDQPHPYADSSYVSNHAGPENSNYIPCGGPLSFESGWHALATHLAAQPNTFSPDGGVTYLTTTPGTDGFTLHALDAATGVAVWQRADFALSVAASSVEVAADGLLFVADRNVVSALRAVDGSTLWSVELPDKEDPGLVYGVKFTADGHVVTQTSNGTLYLLDRGSGRRLADLDVAAVTGYVPPAARAIPVSLLPDFILARAGVVLGTDDPEALKEGIAGLFGASGAFADNTVCTTARRQVFTIGGGPTPETGAVVAANIVGGSSSPSLEFAWSAVLPSGSASSVVAMNGGRKIVLADGAGTIHLFDTAACNRNADADPDPTVCGEAWTYAQPGTVPGALAVDPEGRIFFVVAGKERQAAAIALRDAGDRAELLWARSYDEGEMFSTVLTVTENAVYGLLSRIEPVEFLGRPVYIPGIPLPLPSAPVVNRAVALDPASGAILWSTPAPNSSITELILSPRGDLFLTMAGGAEILVLDREAPDPVAGLLRLTPVATGF